MPMLASTRVTFPTTALSNPMSSIDDALSANVPVEPVRDARKNMGVFQHGHCQQNVDKEDDCTHVDASQGTSQGESLLVQVFRPAVRQVTYWPEQSKKKNTHTEWEVGK